MSYFADLDSKRFSFVSNAMGMNEQTFAVINFKGYESISKPYEFDILLVSNEMELDLGDVLNSSAQFLIHRGGDAGKDDVLFNGVLASFEQLQEFNGNVIYRAKLVPKLWWLSLTKHNQVFLNDTVPELVRLCLEDADLLSSDYDFSGVTGDYKPHEYVCQYGESHFTFVSRWLEREGIYYYFSQDDDGEQIRFSDANTTAETLDDADLFYSPESGLESTHLSEVIRSLTCRQRQLPKEITLKDYNYARPDLDVTGRASVDRRKGRGNHFVYGEHFDTPEEGDRLAGIRAEELLCQQKEFHGESTVPFMNPGYTFNLLNHYRGDYNQEYLIVEVTHEGSQTACLTPEIIGGLDKPDEKIAYANSFKAIPSITQFRPERTTERPRISGTINARIDAEGSTMSAQIDKQGRYKIKLPFDINDQHMDGKASAWLRMMQPSAGVNEGIHFSLKKGTEVMLMFVDGHPDRPVIAGAVSNPETPSIFNPSSRPAAKMSIPINALGGGEADIQENKLVSASNMTAPASNPIQSNVQNISLDHLDEATDKLILGGGAAFEETASDYVSEYSEASIIGTSGLLSIESGGGFIQDVSATGRRSDVSGDHIFPNFKIAGNTEGASAVAALDAAALDDGPGRWPFRHPVLTYNEDADEDTNFDGALPDNILSDASGNYIINRRYGDSYNWTDGNTYNWDNEKVFGYGNDYEEIHEMDDIRGYQQFLNFEDTDGLHMTGFDPTDSERNAAHQNYDKNYPKSKYHTSYSGFKDGCDSLIEKIWGDKVEYHYGRAFNFSGGPGPGSSNEAYNYGNGYTEDLLEKSTGCFAQHYPDSKHDRYLDADAPVTIDTSKASMGKKAGDDYSYFKGKELEVKEDNFSYSEGYGSYTDERTYTSGGTITSKNTKDYNTGVSEEHLYNIADGNPVSFKSEAHGGGGLASFSTYYVNQVALEISFSGSLSAKLELGGKLEMELFVGVGMEIKQGAGQFLTIENILGGHLEVDQGEVTGKFFGAEIGTKTLQCLAGKGPFIEARAANISNAATGILSIATRVSTGAVNLRTYAVNLFM
jgi:type VI secretion system VgrG family protein